MDDQKNDPARSDAAIVYRWLKATAALGGSAVDEIAFQCFPLPITGGPDTTMKALRRRSVKRVLDSLLWIRAQGVVVAAVPGAADEFGGHELTRYALR